MVRIRLKRMGRRNRPFYRINAVEKREKRDGKVLENLGWYDPVARDESKQVFIKDERVKFWLGQGAQASDTVNDLLARMSIIDAEAWKAERESRYAKLRAAAIEKKQAAQEAEAKAAAEAAEAERKAAEEAAATADAAAEGGENGSGDA